jgi:hypothetical protein
MGELSMAITAIEANDPAPHRADHPVTATPHAWQLAFRAKRTEAGGHDGPPWTLEGLARHCGANPKDVAECLVAIDDNPDDALAQIGVSLGRVSDRPDSQVHRAVRETYRSQGPEGWVLFTHQDPEQVWVLECRDDSLDEYPYWVLAIWSVSLSQVGVSQVDAAPARSPAKNSQASPDDCIATAANPVQGTIRKAQMALLDVEWARDANGIFCHDCHRFVRYPFSDTVRPHCSPMGGPVYRVCHNCLETQRYVLVERCDTCGYWRPVEGGHGYSPTGEDTISCDYDTVYWECQECRQPKQLAVKPTA